MSYTGKNIKILKGLDAVKKRPGMYIGNTEDGSGLHRMLFELLDNALDEHYAGYCSKILITIHTNSSITIEDNGRGIPTEMYENTNKTTPEIILTTLHSGAKFDNNTYKFSSGLHGVGLSVVNALSQKLTLTIYKNNILFLQEYENGELLTTKTTKNDTQKTQGTKIQILPNHNIIKPEFFDQHIIKQRLKELTYLNKNLTLELTNELNHTQQTFTYSNGVKDFLQQLIKKKPIGTPFFLEETVQNTELTIGLQWTYSETETIIGYTNNTKQKEGGTHIAGLRAAIIKTILEHIENLNIAQKDKLNINSNDIKEGLVGIIAIKTTDPKFTSQTKEKLITTQIKNIVENTCRNALSLFFIKQKETCKLIVNKILQTAKARITAKKIKDSIHKEDYILLTATLPGKLAECQSNDPEKTELFLVEGDSAGGSAKQARCRINQAILPLKGKIINTGKASLSKLMENNEIRAITAAIGCVVVNNKYVIKNLRYKTIIIMTDADTDGSHIRALLLTFFFKHLPELFFNENIYIAQPPLYKVQQNKKSKYLNDEAELKNYIINLSLENITFGDANLHTKSTITDFKKLLHTYTNLKNELNNILNIDVDIFLHHVFSNINLLIDVLKENELTPESISSLISKVLDSTNTQPCVYKKQENAFYFYVNKKKAVLNVSTFFSTILPLLTECTKFHNTYFKNNILKIYSNEKELLVTTIKDVHDELITKIKQKIYVQRYKGLGEMNPDQLWETTMCPENRHLKKIKILDIVDATTIFNILMGTDIISRKKFLLNNVLLYNKI